MNNDDVFSRLAEDRNISTRFERRVGGSIQSHCWLVINPVRINIRVQITRNAYIYNTRLRDDCIIRVNLKRQKLFAWNVSNLIIERGKMMMRGLWFAFRIFSAKTFLIPWEDRISEDMCQFFEPSFLINSIQV